ncbi:SAM-dependent methyltransferase [Stagnihabitans tardus]|uniref:tRNA (N6-threonylcarbamoyladenosine(37)-N6)-methyltransferase TrmO n=1 Tax=Stagnihabitans tardus TaxID=2699202 RepID=A0AAE4YCG5_9RHOB|nr:SAM-dependent methyltransferase [Stagnihabitans tardus]NBZ89484.1 tRNA (N6-threonylcarbamoyladenosine(37)-N6)-methyltransferase TrmO [Stagnihabitans tardus]
MTDETRPGEMRLDVDLPQGAALLPIGRLRSPWAPGDAPKNLREARERGGTFAVEVDAPFRPGLLGLEVGQTIILLYWMDRARRDLIVQSPGHKPAPTGTFALRSPVRPNPVALAVVRILTLEPEAGRLTIDALDAFDGTPLLDIKPWLASVDIPPE